MIKRIKNNMFDLSKIESIISRDDKSFYVNGVLVDYPGKKDAEDARAELEGAWLDYIDSTGIDHDMEDIAIARSLVIAPEKITPATDIYLDKALANIKIVKEAAMDVDNG